MGSWGVWGASPPGLGHGVWHKGVRGRVSIFLEGDLGCNFFDRKEALHAERRRREARVSYFSIALITIEKTSLCPF